MTTSFRGREPRSNAIAPQSQSSHWPGGRPRPPRPAGRAHAQLAEEDADPRRPRTKTPRVDVLQRRGGLPRQSTLPTTRRPQKVAAAVGRLQELHKQMLLLEELDTSLRLAKSDLSRTDSDHRPPARKARSMPRYHAPDGGRVPGWQDLHGAADHSSQGSHGSRGGLHPMKVEDYDEEEEGGDGGMDLDPEALRKAIREEMRGAFAVAPPLASATPAPPTRKVLFADGPPSILGHQPQHNPFAAMAAKPSGYTEAPAEALAWGGEGNPDQHALKPVGGWMGQPAAHKAAPEGSREEPFGKKDGKDDREQLRHRSAVFRPNHSLGEATPVSLNLLFGGFTQRSPLRMKCFEIYKSSSWATFFLCVTLANSLYIAFAPIETTAPADGDASVTAAAYTPAAGDIFDYTCVLILCMEILCGWIAIGAFESEHTWLRTSNYNKLDLIVFIVTVTEFIAAFLGQRGLTLRPFRLLRIFRVATTIKMFGGVKAIIHTLGRGSGQLLTVFAMLMFFVAAFSICGMAIFSTSFRRRCVTLPRPVPACASDFDTGWTGQCDLATDLSKTKMSDFGKIVISDGYPFQQWCKLYKSLPKSAENDALYPWDPAQLKYHDCQVHKFRRGEAVWQTCVEVDNPSMTFSHFDHIGGAVLSILQGAAPDGYYDIIHRSLQSEPDVAAMIWLLYIGISCICTFLLLGLFVAVVTGTFAQVREAEGESGFLAAQRDDESDESDSEWLDRGRFARHALNTPTKETKEGRGDARPMSRAASIRNVFVRSARDLANTLGGGGGGRKTNEEEEDGEEVMRKFCAQMAESNWRVRLYSLVILCHTVAMATDQHDAGPDMRAFSQNAYLACNFFFAADLILVFISCDGFGEFWGSSKNRLELSLVAIGCAGLVTGSKFLLLIPAVRLYYLMAYFPTLQALLISAITSTGAILNLILFISLVAMCFALAGRYIFKGDMAPFTRSNFSTFPNALLTIFQLLTGDSWSAVVYSAMASQETVVGQLFAASFILSWFAFSSLIVKNLFVAVIIENFQVAETIANIGKAGYVSTARGFIRDAYAGLYEQSRAFRSHQVEIDVNTGKLGAKKKLDYTFSKHVHKSGDKRAPASGYGGVKSVQNDLLSQVTISVQAADRDVEEEERDTVLGCFGNKNSLRRFFVWLGKQPLFDFVVYSAIIISCVFLMLAPPNDELNETEGVLDMEKIAIVNTVFTCLFTVEFVTKVMSQGLIFTKFAYLKSGWNQMDSVVLCFAWIDETGMLANSGMAKVVRLARALRPLRLMKRNQGMRVVIDALIRTLAPVIYVVVFSVFTFVVAALIGMGLFGGKMLRCSTPGAEWPGGKAECSGASISDGSVTWGMSASAPPGVLVPRAWVTPPYNFDSVWTASFTLYRVNTVKYVAIIFDAKDITDYDISPKEDHSEIFALFFIVYLIVGGLFVMNLFVGFIVDGFNANKGASVAEIHYHRFVKLLTKSRPKYEFFATPKNPVSKALRKLVMHRYFQAFSATCVVTNVLFMLADHAEPNDLFLRALQTQNDFFFGVLIGEIFLYFCAYGAGGFINDMWKLFDLFVCIGTLTGYAQANERLAQFAKSFRLMRVVRLMKMFKPIRIILETMLSSLPQLANILLLILLVYSMFAVIAVSTFGTVKYGRRLGPTANFESFPKAIYTCYQMITGDEWMDISNDCAVEPPYCTLEFSKAYVYGWTGPDHTYGDCGTSLAPFYFTIFKLVCESVMLNLFIGMILDNFSFITDEVAHVEDAEWSQGASSAQVQDLARCFMEFDCGTAMVPLTSLHSLMCTMQQPLGYRNENNEVIYGHAERTAEILVRAELNLILRQDREEEAKKDKSWWQKKTAWLRHHKKFTCAMGFDDLMLTLLYWRMPLSVPDYLKIVRQDRVEEVVLMAQALAITDFFRLLVARRRQVETRKSMAQRILFWGWSVKDPHYTRRLRETLAIQNKERQAAKLRHQAWRNLQIPPSAFAFIDFHPLDMLPTGTREHNSFLVEKMRAPKPRHGLELFRDKSAVNYTVLRFIDSRNEKKGLVLAAFEKELFEGWHATNLSKDTFFSPKRRKQRAEHRSEPWVKLDCRMRTREVDRMGRRLNRWKPQGVLLDVQSFVVSEGLDHNGHPLKPRSVVRINIGTMRDVHVNVEEDWSAEKKAREKLLWHDGVLEVVGYVNTTLEEVEEERMIRQEAEKDIGYVLHQDDLGYMREAL